MPTRLSDLCIFTVAPVLDGLVNETACSIAETEAGGTLVSFPRFKFAGVWAASLALLSAPVRVTFVVEKLNEEVGVFV